MRDETIRRRFISLEEAIRVLHKTIMEVDMSIVVLKDRLDALASDQGLEGDRSPSPPRPSLRDDKDDAGGK